MKRMLSILLALLLTAALLAPALPVTAGTVPTHVTVAQPVTHVIGDLSVIREIASAEQLDALVAAEKKPSTAILSIDGELNLLDGEGAAFSTVEEFLQRTAFSVIPAFYLTTMAELEALQAFLDEKGFYDCFIISHKTGLIEEARNRLPSISTAIDFSDKYDDVTVLDEEMLLDIRTRMKKYGGTVAILPSAVCTKEAVQYLYDRQVNVWSMLPSGADRAEQYAAILSGAIGVISDSPESILAIACEELSYNTLTRVPLNVGHRAIPSKAPENTIEGALLAYELGADVIEIDVYLTTDGEVVVMHDGTTGRTCDKNIVVEGSTLAQLKELYVNKGFETDEKYKNCRIPTLGEFLNAFKGTDCQLFIEIKSSKTAIVPAVKDLVEGADMYGQCSVITFNEGIMAEMRDEYPEMSVGALCQLKVQGDAAEEGLRAMMNYVGPYNATYNPSHTSTDVQGARAALMRGISVYPWTFSGTLSSYKDAFFWGCAGLTGNDAHLFAGVAERLALTLTEQPVAIGEAISLEPVLSYYQKEAEATSRVKLQILSGEELVRVDGTTVTPQACGEVSFILTYETFLTPGTTYTLCTDPITLSIPEKEPDEETLPEETLPEAEPETGYPDAVVAPKRSRVVWIVTGGFLALVAAGAVLAVVLIRKRRA